MDVATLHRLSRTLREIALQAAMQEGDTQVSPSQVTIIEDVAHNPKTTAQQIVRRTGIAQSQVSTIVAEFKQQNIFIVGPDPRDGRKQQIQISPEIKNTVFKNRGKQLISKALAQLQPNLTKIQCQRAGALLSELSSLLNKSQP